MNRKIPIAVFASGTGTTFKSLISYSTETSSSFIISALVTDKPNCGAAGIADENSIRILKYGDQTIQELKNLKIEMLILAGFLKIITEDLITAFKDMIINTHPSLLPAFGGTGMYGKNVHRAVIRSGTFHSGFTVHLVTSAIDSGPIVFQHSVPVFQWDSEETLGTRVHEAELQLFPKVIDSLCRHRFKVVGNRVTINYADQFQGFGKN